MVGVSIAWIFRAREGAQVSATPPEAKHEYSRGEQADRVPSGPVERVPAPARSAILVGVLAGGLLGAGLLAVAEFTTLYQVHSSASAAVVRSVGTGSNHSYALLPIAALAAFLAFGVWRAASRPALLALGVIGVIALLIALLGDLPDAHASGLVGSSASHFVQASSRPSAGFYMETLGAVVLLITCVSGFILLGAPARPGAARRVRRAPAHD